MKIPTPEEINQIAKECGSRGYEQPFTTTQFMSDEALQAFFLRGIEVGRKMQRDSDLQICERADRYRGDYFAQLIRNNTGE